MASASSADPLRSPRSVLPALRPDANGTGLRLYFARSGISSR